MRCSLFIILAIVIVMVHANPQRRRQRQRGARTQLDTGYGAPAAADYGAPSEEVIDVRSGDLAVYAEEQPLDSYELDAEGSEELEAKAAASGDAGLDMLMKSIPGVPGEDYPIYAEAPETAFACDGQVNGGYYADPEALCQVFHICSDDGAGGLAKYSFLCPNGTIFNQAYFICDWWFNVDCSEAEALAEARNGDLIAGREAADARLAEVSEELDEAESGYGAPVIEARQSDEGYGAPLANYNYDDY